MAASSAPPAAAALTALLSVGASAPGLLRGVPATRSAASLHPAALHDGEESVGSRLDRVLPFTLLKRVPGLKYIPGSLAERRACGNSMINAVPGTHPTQSYHCPSPLALPAHPSAQGQGFHHSHTLGHQAPQQGPAAGHSLSSSHCQARGAFGECPGQAHARALPGQCCQLGKFSVPQRVCPAQPQPPTATGLQQAPGYPAAPVAPVSAEFTRVQVY